MFTKVEQQRTNVAAAAVVVAVAVAVGSYCAFTYFCLEARVTRRILRKRERERVAVFVAERVREL